VTKKKETVDYSRSCAFPAQSLSGPISADHTTKFYCLKFETPSIWKAIFPYLFPPGIYQAVTTQGIGFT
jgi:hypothetical protein